MICPNCKKEIPDKLFYQHSGRELGEKHGSRGGASTSPAAVQASRDNLARARAIRAKQLEEQKASGKTIAAQKKQKKVYDVAFTGPDGEIHHIPERRDK